MGRALTIDWRPAGPENPEEKLFRPPAGETGELLYCQTKQTLLQGPARSGKSRCAIEKLHYIAMACPGCQILLVRQTQRSLTHSVLQTYEGEVLPFKSGVRFNHEAGEYRYPNGSKMVIGGLDNPDKILSTGWDLIYVNQAEEIDQDAYQKLLSRLSGSATPFRQIILDINPADPQHWINQYFPPQGPAVDEKRRLVSKHEDNPRMYDQDKHDWTDFGREYLKTLESLTGATYQRLRLGLWVAAEGQFFTEWDPEVHICKPFDVPKDWPRWLAVDYGFADPFCCLFCARDPKDKRMYIYRELYGPGLRDEQQARLIAKAMQGERIVRLAADPSMFNQRKEQGKPSIARIYWDNGVRIRPAANRRIDGWQAVRRALAHEDSPPRLQIMDGRAPNLVRTLPAMVCDPFDPEDLADKLGSVKTDDHGVDTLRYLCVSEATAMPTRQIQEVRFG